MTVTDRALILTYHGIEAAPGPLSIDVGEFAAQLDCLRECGAEVLALSDLFAGLLDHRLPHRALAITFDDGLLSVAETAVPLLIERGMRATIFCVAGRLGGDNRWSTQPPTAPRRALATSAALADLAAAGFEIGAHGVQHMPLSKLSPHELRREIVDSREMLEQQLGTPVAGFAYPYGAIPGAAGQALIRSTYRWACTTRPGYVTTSAGRFDLPRVDVHYLRRPRLMRRAAAGTLGGYIELRRTGSRVRRLAVKDFVASSG